MKHEEIEWTLLFFRAVKLDHLNVPTQLHYPPSLHAMLIVLMPAENATVRLTYLITFNFRYPMFIKSPGYTVFSLVFK